MAGVSNALSHIFAIPLLTFLTSIPVVPSNTFYALASQLQCCMSRIAPAQQLCCLSPMLALICHISPLHVPLASRTCPDRSLPSGRVKDTISLNRGNLTCTPHISISHNQDRAPPHVHSQARPEDHSHHRRCCTVSSASPSSCGDLLLAPSLQLCVVLW